ncbi:MAG TPA: hypothetical protein VGJ26_02600 [Pirellulales bacterium]|jgi:hypothetical protein
MVNPSLPTPDSGVLDDPRATPDPFGVADAAPAQKLAEKSKPAATQEPMAPAETLSGRAPASQTLSDRGRPTSATPQPPSRKSKKPEATKNGPKEEGKPEASKKELTRRERISRVRGLSWITVVPSWFISLVFHMTLLLSLAMIAQPTKVAETFKDLVSTRTEKIDDLEQIAPETTDTLGDQPESVEGIAEGLSLSDEAKGMEITDIRDAAAPPLAVDVTDVGLQRAPVADLAKAIGKVGGTGLEGRGDAARKSLVYAHGGNADSENSVGLALEWLAAHQLPDGSWNFNHQKGACKGLCANPGQMDRAEIAATALGLLPFLGAGQTHMQGKYKKNVQGGLYFLVNKMKVGPNGGDLGYEQGNMYGHGLASIALCEAYALSKDKSLAVPAQQALNFIVYAQDPLGGGWRYQPRMPGDTSVVGWQLMALKSGHMAYLDVPPQTIKGVTNFLNTVQTDSGARYGYTDGAAHSEATTAIGLLCRMYLGWKHDESALERGVQFLSKRGPSETNMYFNYYATQVLHHYEGEEWTTWNTKMRDFLIKEQKKSGHEKGSWYLQDSSAMQGGRLYTTAMCAMTLEVYYRHLPIYQKQSTDADFD